MTVDRTIPDDVTKRDTGQVHSADMTKYDTGQDLRSFGLMSQNTTVNRIIPAYVTKHDTERDRIG